MNEAQMRRAIREALEILCATLNRLDELARTERNFIRRLQLQNAIQMLTRARGYLIDQDRQEER